MHGPVIHGDFDQLLYTEVQHTGKMNSCLALTVLWSWDINTTTLCTGTIGMLKHYVYSCTMLSLITDGFRKFEIFTKIRKDNTCNWLIKVNATNFNNFRTNSNQSSNLQLITEELRSKQYLNCKHIQVFEHHNKI